MITIKIKTWSDYKKQFFDWVKEPRRQTCSSYADYMDSVAQEVIEKRFKNMQKDLSVDDKTLEVIIETAQVSVSDARHATYQLINKKYR